ncbi:hypothetical protein SIPHO067v1_p0047 [Vibrio phage 51E28.1]|nr:hypothetical protein SIPHO067v1_p0047 [Vibrio phage 51E28.1]
MMATEIPNRYTLAVTIFIGSKEDMTVGMSALAKQFPDNIKPDPEGWVIDNIGHQFIEDMKDVFMEDKIKLTERFELNFIQYLSWVVSRRFAKLHLSINEPIHHIKATPWEWKQPKAKAVKNEADSNDS